MSLETGGAILFLCGVFILATAAGFTLLLHFARRRDAASIASAPDPLSGALDPEAIDGVPLSPASQPAPTTGAPQGTGSAGGTPPSEVTA